MGINYVGDFKILKPMGYSFFRLFGGNHIYYNKSEILVRRAGKIVEICDLYDYSSIVLNCLIENNFSVEKDHNSLVVNLKTLKIENMNRCGFFPDEDEFRTFNISRDTVNNLRELYEKKVLQIVD